MSDEPLQVLAVVGSLNPTSVTRSVLLHLAERLRADGCSVDVLDLETEPLALYNPDTAYDAPGFGALQTRVERADVYVLGTPDYHGSISSAMKNFLDHFWREFTGKLFATLVASHEKGLTVTDQLRTVARQCYAWTLPYGVAFTTEQDVKGGAIVSDHLQNRLEMMARDLACLWPAACARRRADFAGTGPGFLARCRKAAL